MHTEITVIWTMNAAHRAGHVYVASKYAIQSCPWVGLTRGLGWVGNGSKICVFSGLGWVMGLKWQMSEKYMSHIYVILCRVSTGKFVL